MWGSNVQDSAAPSAEEETGYRVSLTRCDGHWREIIEVGDAGEAHRIADVIAKAGGRAEVQYVTRGGSHQTLATYP